MNRRFIFDRREKREQRRRTWPFSRQGRRLKLTKAGRIWLAGLAAALLVAVCVLPTLAEWLGEAGSEPAVSTEEISVEQEQDMAAEQTPDSNVNSISDPEEEERDDYLQDLIIPRQQYNTFLSEAYLGNNEATEQVNPQTGEFTYRHTDYSLPGKNGLDLNITRIYKSAQTPRFDRSLDVYHLTKSRDSTYSGFYEQRYNIGAGVRFSFPTIEVRGYQEDNTYRYLHDESGAVRRMIGPETIDGVKTYELEGYELEDLRIIEEQTPTFTGVINGLGYDYSKYVMIEKDGTKTYFSGRPNSDNCLTEGRIMAIVDRYGNTIRFDYEYYIYDYSVSWDVNVGEDRWSKRVLLSKITDTMGREVTIEYPKTEADVDEVKDGTFNVKITTPDNQMLVYSFKNFFVDGPNTDYALRQQLVKVSVLGDASQFGVNGNYGEMKYFYGYNVMPFQYKDTGYVQNSEYLDVNFILYGQTNRAKILTYDKGTKSYSYSGFMEYPKVVKEEDVLLEGCSLNDIRDRFDDVNYNLRNYLAVAEYVGEKNYTYNGEPDGYEVDADTDETSKTYPLINFEDTKAKDSFEEISEQSPQWQVTSDQAKSGEKSMCSLTNAESPAIKLPANLLKDGSLIFHAMEQGDGDLYVGIGTNEPSQMTKFELTESWNRYSLELPQDSADIWFLYDRKGTDAVVYLDDITVGIVYSSQVQDEYGTITYQYDPLHQTYAVQTASQDNAYTMTEQREYDLYGQLRKATTSRLDEGEQTPLVVEKLYTYDQYGNLLEYQGPEYANAKLTYTYDTNCFHQLTSRKLSDTASGQTLANTAYYLDTLGNTTVEVRYISEDEEIVSDFTYDSAGNMTSKTTSHNDSAPYYTTYYEYAAAGTYDGYTAQGGKAEYANEPLYLTRVYTGASSAPLSEKRYTYEFDTGLMASETTGANTTTYTYDSQYRLTSAIYPDKEEFYTYYPGGTQVGTGMDTYTDFNYIIEVQSGRSNLRYVYDIFGNLIRQEDKDTGRVLEEREHDQNGNVIRLTDGNGNTATYAFDRLNRLLERKTYDSAGALKGAVTLDYTDQAAGKLSQCGASQSVTVTDENASPTTYYLDSAERIVGTETTPDGSAFYLAKTVYDSLGNVTAQVDALGNTTSFTYDRLSRLTKKTDALGGVTTYAYNALDKLAEKDEPGSKRTTYEYDAAGRMVCEKVGDSQNLANEYTYTQYTYDKSNNKTSQKKGTYRVTDSGTPVTTVDESISYTYHGSGKVYTETTLLETTAEGDVTTTMTYEYNDYGELYLAEQHLDYSSPYGISIAYSYDSLGRKTNETTTAYYPGAPNENVGCIVKNYTYDGNNNVTELSVASGMDSPLATNYVYDYRNLVTQKREPAGSGSQQRTTNYEYDAVGNLTKQSLVLGSDSLEEAYTYDKMNRMVSKTNALGQTERYAYDAAGNQTAVADARYQSAPLSSAPGLRYTYDALGRQTETAVFDGSSTTTIEKRQYDGRGNLLKTIDGQYAATGQAPTYAYNAQNLPVSYTPASSSQPARTMEYDGAGRLIRQTDYADEDTSYTTAYTYRGDGLIASVQYPDSSTESYSYDLTGKLFEQRTDGNGGVTKIYKTLFGTPYKTEYPDGTTTTTDYNWYLGLALVAIDQKSRRKKYAYDRAGNLIEQDVWYDSDGTNDYWKTTKNTYDLWGNLLSSEDFKKVTNAETGAQSSLTSLGNQIAFQYDDLFRAVKQTGPNGRETKTEYDAAGNQSETHVKLWNDYYEIQRYTYDAAGRLSAESVLVPGGILSDPHPVPNDSKYTSFKALTTTYAYTGKNVTAKTDALGNTTTYEYNADGKLSKTTDPLGGATTYTYDLLGNLTRESSPIGGYISYTYDSRGRMSGKYQSDTSGSASYGWQWQYDAVGNVTGESTPQMQLSGAGFNTYTYDSMNRRTSSKNAEGQLLEAVTYDAVGNVLKRVDGLHCTDASAIATASGETYAYDGLDRMVSKTDALGGTTAYEYDLLGNLTKQTDARGNATTYQYSSDSLLTKVTYPDGGQISYRYDGKGRMNNQEVKQSSGVTVATHYAYTPFDELFTEEDSAGNMAYYKYDAAQNLTAVTDKRGYTMSYTYDAAGRVSSKQTPLTQNLAMTETYAYDAAGNLTQTTLAGSSSNSRVTTNTYYPNGLLASTSTGGGQQVQYTYNQAGLLLSQSTLRSEGAYDTTTYAYDAYERLTSETRTGLGEGYQTGDAASVSATASYTYNVLGMKTSETSPRGASASYTGQYTTTYAYDGLNRLQSVSRYHEGGASPQLVSTTYTYDAAGNTASVTDEAGHTTSYTYDSMNRVLTVTNARGVQALSYTYDLAGNVTGETRPNGTTTYEYDNCGRLTLTKAPDGGVTAAYEYDAAGNVVKVMDGLGYAASPQYGVTYTYNAAGLVSAVTDPEGGATTYTYDALGDRIAVTDATGRTTAYTYNLDGQLAAVIDAAGSETAYTYDAAGNLTSMTDALGHQTTYAYGAFGVLASVTDAAGRQQTYTYDVEGNLVAASNRAGVETAYTYDNRGRLTGKSAAGVAVTYAYDTSDNRTAMTDQTGAYSYAYDATNRLTSVSKDGISQISYAYDDSDNITSKTYAGQTVSYEYDSRSRMTSVSGAGLSAAYTYDAANNLTQATVGGQTTTYAYNKNNAATSISIGSASGATTIAYTYDAAGRVLTMARGSLTTTYTYDAAGRLSQAALPGKTVAYAYDAAGNRTQLTEQTDTARTYTDAAGSAIAYSKKVTAYEYSSTNELAKTTAVLYNEDIETARLITTNSYNPDGSLYSSLTALVRPGASEGGQLTVGTAGSTAVNLTEYAYDAFGRQQSVTVTKGTEVTTTSYAYNGDGLRTSRTVTDAAGSSQTVNYVLDGQNVAAQTGSRSVAYVSGAAGYVGQSENGAGLYYRANAHGDVVLVTDASGTVVNSYEYDAFGEAVASVETANVEVRYAGEFYDATTGQYYLRARYYDPSTGRFTSEDTYRGDPQNPSTLNLYAYCAGDPVNYVDPSGHKVSGISNWDKLSSQQKSNIESAERARKNGYISRSEYEANVKLNGGQVSSGGASGGSSSSGSSTSSANTSSGGGKATGGSRKGSTTSGTAKQNTPQEDELQSVIDEIESNAAADIAELETRKNSSAVTGTEDEEIAEILSGVEEAKSKLHQGLSGSRGNGKAASEQEKTAQFEGTEEEVRQQVRSQAMGILEGTVQVSWTEKEEEEEEKIEKIKESTYIGSNMGSFQPLSYQSFTEVDPFGGYTETNAGLFTLELLRLLALSKKGEDVGLSDDFLMYKIKKSPLMNYDLFAWAVKYYFDYLGYARFVDVQTLLLIGSFTNVAYYSKDVYLPDNNNIAETYPYGNRLLGEAYDVLRTSNLVNIFQWKGDGTNYWGRNWESEVPGSAQKVITKSSYNMNTNEGIIELRIWDQYQGQVKIAPNNITFEYMDGGPEIGFLSLPDGMKLKGFKPYI